MMTPVDETGPAKEQTARKEMAQRRMHGQRLAGPGFGAPTDVVGWLVAMQAQDFGPAKWSVGDRVDRVSDAAIDRAFNDGAILRTHVLRPTWHFVSPADIRWLLELTGPRVQAQNAHYYRRLGLDAGILDRCTALLVEALGGGNHLTRKELAPVLQRAGVDEKGFGLGYVLMNAELTGVVCSGVPKGKQQTYALLDERAPEAATLGPDEALAELVFRYFASRGPATAKDLRWWSSLTLAEIDRGLDMVGSRLQRDELDGVTFWSAPAGTTPPPPPSPTIHLLQIYDEYFLGYSESRGLADGEGRWLAWAGGTFDTNAIVLLDGHIAGRWRRTLTKRSVLIEASFHRPLAGAEKEALQAAAERLGEFLGLTPVVESTTR
jgi:Winged helix DNA-binding domain